MCHTFACMYLEQHSDGENMVAVEIVLVQSPQYNVFKCFLDMRMIMGCCPILHFIRFNLCCVLTNQSEPFVEANLHCMPHRHLICLDKAFHGTMVDHRLTPKLFWVYLEVCMSAQPDWAVMTFGQFSTEDQVITSTMKEEDAPYQNFQCS